VGTESETNQVTTYTHTAANQSLTPTENECSPIAVIAPASLLSKIGFRAQMVICFAIFLLLKLVGRDGFPKAEKS
jgi:hypothetical protein